MMVVVNYNLTQQKIYTSMVLGNLGNHILIFKYKRYMYMMYMKIML